MEQTGKLAFNKAHFPHLSAEGVREQEETSGCWGSFIKPMKFVCEIVINLLLLTYTHMGYIWLQEEGNPHF